MSSRYLPRSTTRSSVPPGTIFEAGDANPVGGWYKPAGASEEMTHFRARLRFPVSDGDGGSWELVQAGSEKRRPRQLRGGDSSREPTPKGVLETARDGFVEGVKIGLHQTAARAGAAVVRGAVDVLTGKKN